MKSTGLGQCRCKRFLWLEGLAIEIAAARRHHRWDAASAAAPTPPPAPTAHDHRPGPLEGARHKPQLQQQLNEVHGAANPSFAPARAGGPSDHRPLSAVKNGEEWHELLLKTATATVAVRACSRCAALPGHRTA